MMDLEIEKEELIDLANLLQDKIPDYTVRVIRFLNDQRSDVLYGRFRFSGRSDHHEMVLSSYGHIVEYGGKVPLDLMSEISFVIVESLRDQIEYLSKQLAEKEDTLAEE